MDGTAVGGHAAASGVPASAPPSTGEAAVAAEPGYSPGPVWMRVLPPVAALVVMIWGISGPSYTPDESATMSAMHRTFPQLLYMLGNIDAVHGPYYLVMWWYVRIAGTSEFATRLPSAVAMAATAAVTAAIGRRLVSPRAGLAAGLIFAALPEISLYAQDARPYAFMTTFGALASYALLRIFAARPERRRRWLVGYAVFMAALGLAQVFALLLILAHAVTVLLRYRPGSHEREDKSLALGWLAAVAAAVVVSGPVLWLGYVQRKSLDTITHTKLMSAIYQMFGPHLELKVFLVILICGIAVSVLVGRWRRSLAESAQHGSPDFAQRWLRSWSPQRGRWSGDLLALCVPWLVLPPILLLAGSYVTPVYALRYVLYCLPAAALLAGVALDALGWVAGAVALGVIIYAGIPQQVHVREAHGRDIRGADQLIAAHRLPGDAVIYGTLPAQYEQFAYPYGLARLHDIQWAKTPAQSGTLTGTIVGRGELSLRLAKVRRVWLFGGGPSSVMANSSLVARAGFHLVHAWEIGGISIKLYTHLPRSGAG
jgi:mannosyltransferase